MERWINTVDGNNNNNWRYWTRKQEQPVHKMEQEREGPKSFYSGGRTTVHAVIARIPRYKRVASTQSHAVRYGSSCFRLQWDAVFLSAGGRERRVGGAL